VSLSVLIGPTRSWAWASYVGVIRVATSRPAIAATHVATSSVHHQRRATARYPVSSTKSPRSLGPSRDCLPARPSSSIRPDVESIVALVPKRRRRTAEGYGLRADRGTDEGRFAVRRGTMTAALDPSAAGYRTGRPDPTTPGDPQP